MTMSIELAARIIVIYEGKLPVDGKAVLADRLEAMRQTVEELGLKETGDQSRPLRPARS